MPNIGTVLRDEITRLARRATRTQIDPTRKATAQYRRDIALLKRQVAQLERQVKLLMRKGAAAAPITARSTSKKVRFAAKGLRAQRRRIGLSAADFATLLGVSPQSVYNWEHELARPRAEQIAKLVALRAIGKREARQRLQQAGASR